jgi:hypothetical protein
MLVSAVPSYGQTRFQLPDTTPDYAHYRTAAQCWLAVGRAKSVAERQGPVWRDTTELLHGLVLDSTPPAVVEVARRCSAPFQPESASLDEYRELLSVYLSANRDDAAATVIARRLEGLSWAASPDGLSRTDVLWTALSAYADARPIRWTKVLSIAQTLKAHVDLSLSVAVYDTLFKLAGSMGDSAAQRQFAEQLIAAVDRISPAVKATPAYVKIARKAYDALNYLQHQALLDSLRTNDAWYVATKQANWKRLASQARGIAPDFTGEKAVHIVGDFWYRPATTSSDGTSKRANGQKRSPADSMGVMVLNADGAPAPIRPTPGKVSLVVFVRGGCYPQGPSFRGLIDRPTYRDYKGCWDTYAILHRFAKRFPSIEITLVSQTTGYLGWDGPLTPEAEAHLQADWWLGFHHLPAALAVVNTPFDRLPQPDHRRIDKPVANNVNYLYGTGTDIPPQRAYLVDETGTILYADDLNRFHERDFREILDVVTRRAH